MDLCNMATDTKSNPANTVDPYSSTLTPPIPASSVFSLAHQSSSGARPSTIAELPSGPALVGHSAVFSDEENAAPAIYSIGVVDPKRVKHTRRRSAIIDTTSNFPTSCGPRSPTSKRNSISGLTELLTASHAQSYHGPSLSESMANPCTNLQPDTIDTNRSVSAQEHGHVTTGHAGNRFRGRKASASPSSTVSEYEFPSRRLSVVATSSDGSTTSFSSVDMDDNLTTLTSPRSDEGKEKDLRSVFPVKSQAVDAQPNLQEVFITLASKERKVLEAREQLLNAEDELRQFRIRWRTALRTQDRGTRSLGTDMDFDSHLNSNSSDLKHLWPLSPDLTSELIVKQEYRNNSAATSSNRHHRRHHSRARRAILSPIRRQVSATQGLGLNLTGYVSYPHDDDLYLNLYEEMNDIDQSEPIFNDEDRAPSKEVSTLSSSSLSSPSRGPSRTTRESELMAQKKKTDANARFIYSVLRYFASLGEFFLRELGILFLFGKAPQDQTVVKTSINPRYPSVVETYYANYSVFRR